MACSFILSKINDVRREGYREPGPSATNGSNDEILGAIERLGQLKEAGILSENEFQTKKAELLKRL